MIFYKFCRDCTKLEAENRMEKPYVCNARILKGILLLLFEVIKLQPLFDSQAGKYVVVDILF